MAKGNVLMHDNTSSPIVTDCRTALIKAGFAESEADLFVANIAGVLDDYADFLGEGTRVQYYLVKKLAKIEVRIMISGKAFDPFTEGEGARKRIYEKMFSLNLNAESFGFSYKYTMRCNIISVSIPLAEKPKKLIKDPVIWGVILGIIAGVICRLLPQETGSFILTNIATPVQNVVLKVISGVMGPVIFFSLISSTSALGSINDLTNRGFKIIGRFLVTILFLIIVSVLVSGLLFQNFGASANDFTLDAMFSMLLDIIPTNVVDPFLKNKTAQLVVMGLLTGAGLLMLGDSVSGLKQTIDQINKCVMSIMRIVLLTLPAIPFLSLMIVIGSGKESDLLNGWKFILASYIIYILCIIIKAVKTSIRSGIRIPDLWRMIRPAAKISFTTASTTASLKKVYEISENEMKIKPGFSSFWIPMSTAMLSPKTAINVIVGAFMAAQLANVPVSTAFLVVLIIITVELSIASPGIPASWTAMLTTLGLPLSFVGLFTTYRLLTDNFGSAVCISYNMLEEVEVAHKLGEIQES